MLLSEPVQRSIDEIHIMPETSLDDWEPGYIDDDEVRAIAERGLRRPIGVTATGELVFGLGELRACRELGWAEVRIVIVDIAGIIAGAYSGEHLRREFDRSQCIGIRRAILRHVLSPDIFAALTAG
jgi:hypothetical protein